MESSTALSILFTELGLTPLQLVHQKMDPRGFIDGDCMLFDAEFGWLRYCPIAQGELRCPKTLSTG